HHRRRPRNGRELHPRSPRLQRGRRAQDHGRLAPLPGYVHQGRPELVLRRAKAHPRLERDAIADRTPRGIHAVTPRRVFRKRKSAPEGAPLFAEPISLSSTALTDPRLPPEAFKFGFALVTLRTRRARESRSSEPRAQGSARRKSPQIGLANWPACQFCSHL